MRRLPVLLVLLALPAAVAFVRLLATTPAAVLLGAALPPLACAALLVLAARRARDPAALLGAFLWGAVVAAFFATWVNDAFVVWAGEGRWRPVVPAVAAPLVEEAAKAAGLVLLVALRRGALHDVLGGIVWGALVGLGFTLTENVRYLLLAAVQGGPAGLGRAIYLRALVGGFTHAAFTATAGAGLGWGCQTRSPRARRLAPPLGLLAAMGQHVGWNAVVSGAIARVVCNPALPGGPCREAPTEAGLFVTIPLIVAATLGPGVLALVVIAVRAARRPAG